MEDLRKSLRAPRIYFGLAELLFVIFVVGQFVCVVPHKNMVRDDIIFNIVTAGGALICFTLAVMSWRKKKREAMKERQTGQQAI